MREARRTASAAAEVELQLLVAEAAVVLGHQREAQRGERRALEEQLPGQAEPVVREQVRPAAPLVQQQGRVEPEPAQAQEGARLLGLRGAPRQVPVVEVSWELAAEASMAAQEQALPAEAALHVSWMRYDWPACWR